MRPRRWTVLIVPHDSETPRQFVLGDRGFRLLAGAIGGSALLVLAAAVVLFSPWATPGARLVARENVRLSHEVHRLDSALALIGDSMAVIAEREAQFRQLAGLSPVARDEAIAVASATEFGPESRPEFSQAGIDPRPRPFSALFGDRPGRTDVDALLRRASQLSTAFATISDTMADKLEKLRNTPSIMPTRGWLSGAFSRARLHPILHETRPHEGIDVAAPAGSPIVAPAAGIVVRAGIEGGYGNTVEIDHGNGIMTRYAHCSRIIVRKGMRVQRGQMIATVGNTGLSVSPHLHYEIHVDGKPVNPLTYVIPENELQ